MSDGRSRQGGYGKRRRNLVQHDAHIGPNGYRYLRRNNERGMSEWYPEHRIVMEQMLGRKLDRNETVHHKDGNRLNNACDNLELCQGGQTPGIRLSDALVVARRVLAEFSLGI